MDAAYDELVAAAATCDGTHLTAVQKRLEDSTLLQLTDIHRECVEAVFRRLDLPFVERRNFVLAFLPSGYRINISQLPADVLLHDLDDFVNYEWDTWMYRGRHNNIYGRVTHLWLFSVR
jgi:hypothetical protein